MGARTLLFWTHLAAGVAAGAVILIMSGTGAALALQPPILAWLERDARTVHRPLAADRQPPDALLAAARQAIPGGRPASVTIEVDPARAASVNFGRDGIVYVDPFSGRVTGTGAAAARSVFQQLTEWHRWLAVSGESRPAARAVTGAANLAFCFLAASGLVLWWPRTWTRRAVLAVTTFQASRTGRARDFNWHNTIGFWCAPVLIVLTATGVVMSYPWANALVYRLSGSPLPRGEGGQGRPAGPPAAPEKLSAASVNAAWTVAERRMPTWKTITMRLPARAGDPLAFSYVDGAHWNPFARSTLTIDAGSGAVVRWEPYAAASRGQKARGWIRFAHTGELGGIAAQAVAGLACVGGALLVWTGLSLAVRRFAGSRLVRRFRSPSSAPSAAPTIEVR
jgi:uncharacterized iron-regulated membrane protein